MVGGPNPSAATNFNIGDFRMKKIFILFLLLIAGAPAMAADSYVGIHLVRSAYTVKFADSSKQTWRANWVGLMFGRVLSDGFGFELQLGSVQLGLNSNWATNYNLMVNGKFAYKIAGFLSPYAGAGIGPSYWETDEGKWNFSYQGFTGISFDLMDSVDADIRVTIRNLGRIPDNHIFQTTGSVIETAGRIGVLWKY